MKANLYDYDDGLFKRRTWVKALREKGHNPRFDECGFLNIFVLDIDHCNGPGCSICKQSWCWHCSSLDQIPECTGEKK